MREQDLLAGHHARDADGLPGLVLQHPRLRHGGRAPARARGAGPRRVPARDHVRAQPHHQPPGLARHQRARAGRHHPALLHLPRAREGAGPLRDDLGGPHEHAVLPGGGLRRRHAPRVRAAPARLHRRDARAHRRLRGPAVEQPDLARPHQGDRRAARRGAARPRRHRARPARRGGGPRPAQDDAVLGLRALRLPGAPRGERRRLRPLRPPRARDARVGADHRPGPRRHAGGPPHRRRPEGGAAATGRARHVDGGADPPLQARHRGLPRPRGRGIRGGGEPARRAGLLRGRRRVAQAAAGARARPQLRQPPVPAADGPRRLPGRPDHDDRLARQRDGRGRTGDRRGDPAAHRPDAGRVRRGALAGAARAEVRPDREGPSHPGRPRRGGRGRQPHAGLRREHRLVLRPALPAPHRHAGGLGLHHPLLHAARLRRAAGAHLRARGPAGRRRHHRGRRDHGAGGPVPGLLRPGAVPAGRRAGDHAAR